MFSINNVQSLFRSLFTTAEPEPCNSHPPAIITTYNIKIPHFINFKSTFKFVLYHKSLNDSIYNSQRKPTAPHITQKLFIWNVKIDYIVTVLDLQNINIIKNAKILLKI